MGDIGDVYGGQGFDTNSAPPAAGYDPIPPAWYPASIDGAEVKNTKDNSGKYLEVEFVVLGDDYANRRIFDKITLMNKNSTAVEIGQRALCGLGQACGIPNLTDTAELVSKIIQIRVKIEPAKGGYEAKNKVTAYKPVEGAGTPGGASAAAQVQQAPAQFPVDPASQQTAPVNPVVDAPKARPWER